VVEEGGGGGGTPEGQQKQEAAGTSEGGSGRHVVGWEEERVGEHRVAASADGLRRGVVRRSRGVARGGGGETGGCVWAHGEGWGQRASRAVWGPRDTRAGRAPRHAGVAWGRPSPRTDLENPSGARIGGVGEGWRVWPAPGQGAGPDPPPRRSSRDGQQRHATRRGGFVAVGGPTVGRGVAPRLWTAHPRRPSQNIPIRASKGMTCPDLGEIGFGRGRGCSPAVFPAPLLHVGTFRYGGIYLFGACGVATLAAGVRVWEGFIDRGDAVPIAV